MPLQSLSIDIPPLEHAIEPALVVSPETTVLEVIGLMSHTQGSNCTIACDLSASHASLIEASQQSSVLVAQQSKVLGIFTERDLVQLATSEAVLADVAVAEVMSSPVITLTQTGTQTLFTALSVFRQHDIRHLPILNEQGEMLGVITSESIRRVLQPFNLLKWRRVEEVMSLDVVCAPTTASIFELAHLMTQHKVSCVVITRETFPVGILTERDIVQFQALELDLTQIAAELVMSSPLFSVRPCDSLLFAHQEMQQRHIRRLIVTDSGNQLLGIITQTSMLRVFDPSEMYGVVEVLQQSVEECTAELQVALKQQEELNELKSRFVSMASHDLRNPLSAILVSVDLAEIYNKRGDTAKHDAVLNRIRVATRHMNQLLNDLLLLGQAEAGKLEFNPAPINLEYFCHELIEELKLGTTAAPEIRFITCETCEQTCLDEKLLRQILTNLISNAIKYSPSASTIDFSLVYKDDEAIFRIQDYGLGIPLADQERLFESFYRATNVGSIIGTGLGLAIVKRCVDSHQGTINFVSEQGIGTAFTVSLPLKPRS